MALAAGPKSRRVRPLPARCAPARWVERATGDRLYPWQRAELARLAGADRPRVAYFQMPRKNGKTRFAALLALAEACLKERRHVYAISDSERNLNSTLMRELRDLVGGSEHLRDSVHIFQHHLEVPETGSFIEVRPHNFKATQGINPHLVLADEVHVWKSDDIWAGMQMAGAARDDALLFGITTPGYDLTGLAHGLYAAVKAGDPTVYGRVFEAAAGADVDDRREWRRANPCHRRAGFLAAMEFDRNRLPEHEFRRFRLGLWTATETAWFPYGVWDSRHQVREVAEGERVWLGFDGSYSGDSTALVGVTADGYCFVVGCWENPARPGWRVPRDDVDAVISRAMATYDVAELCVDPPYWETEIAEWATRWPGRVVEFPTYSRARFGPACTTFYSAVMEGRLSHDGDPRLARHVANAVVKPGPAGDVITKADKNSPAKIDLAVAAVVAYHRATTAPAPRPAVFVV